MRNLQPTNQIPYIKKLALEMILLSRFPQPAFVAYITGLTATGKYGCEIIYDSRMCAPLDDALIEGIQRDSGFEVFLVKNNDLPLPHQYKKTRFF